MSNSEQKFFSPDVGGQNPESKNKEEQDKGGRRLQKGDVVSVRRSSGATEDDWIIAGYDGKTGDVIVVKRDQNAGGICYEK